MDWYTHFKAPKFAKGGAASPEESPSLPAERMEAIDAIYGAVIALPSPGAGDLSP